MSHIAPGTSRGTKSASGEGVAKVRAEASAAREQAEAPEKPEPTKPAADNAVHMARSGLDEHVQGPRDEDGQTGRTGASGVDTRVDVADASARVRRSRQALGRRLRCHVTGAKAIAHGGAPADADAPAGAWRRREWWRRWPAAAAAAATTRTMLLPPPPPPLPTKSCVA